MNLQLSTAGKITGSHNLDGALKLFFHLKDNKAISKLKYIFIEVNNSSYIPYFVKSAKNMGEDSFVFVLEDVETAEDAKSLCGKSIYIDQHQLAGFKKEDVYFSFVGYKVKDKKLGTIGTVREIIEMPAQVLADVKTGAGNVLIPLIEETVVNIDIPSETIFVELPDGLLEAQS